jgi:hypothetical protein
MRAYYNDTDRYCCDWHWFAGIGGWELALQMSGYTGPVWRPGG